MLTRDGWACRACGRVCSGSREAHADHIVPITAGGERYDVANGQTLCVKCHGRKTRSEQADASARASQPAQPAGNCRIGSRPTGREGGSDHPTFAH